MNIEQLVKDFPNDAELGREVRHRYFEAKKDIKKFLEKYKDSKIYESPDNMSNAGGNLQFTIGTSYRFRVDTSGNTYSSTSSRAPIFYDTDNTGYYIDPASTSMVNVLQFGGSTNNGRFDADEWGVRFKTDSGYILFGPANTGHAHI